MGATFASIKRFRESLHFSFSWPIGLVALVSVSAAGEQTGSLGPLADFSEVWNGQTLHWRKARYTDSDLGDAGVVGVPFGVALPGGYGQGAGQKHPLVIYLHGANARGDDDNQNLRRPTARFFAHRSLAVPDFSAFVLSPQVVDGQRFVNVDFSHGPYQQSTATLTSWMQLTEALIRYVTNPAHDASLNSVLGFSAADVDVRRLYVVGDSMGAYGTLDTVGRGSIVYAAAIAAGGSGPANRLEQVRRTPFWLIHGEVDVVVPNFLPYMGDPDGGGTLGMLGLIDPTFGNIGSTELITLDDYASAADDPTAAAVLIYSQYPASFDHSTVAIGWTGSMVSDFSTWLFSHPVEEPAPRLELVWDSIGGGWQLEWTGTNWVLQESVGISADWTDATPPNGSPYPVLTGNGSRYYRLREAD